MGKRREKEDWNNECEYPARGYSPPPFNATERWGEGMRSKMSMIKVIWDVSSQLSEEGDVGNWSKWTWGSTLEGDREGIRDKERIIVKERYRERGLLN